MPNANKINISDKILAATFLKLLPKRVTPNQITIFRFFTIPFIALLLWIGEYELGTALFIISAFTDALDGALARTRKKVTKWGSTYDPLADKLLISVTAFLILPRYIGPWIVFAIIFLEMFLIGMAYYNTNHNKKKPIMANWWGKSKMISQSLGVFLVLLYILWSAPILLILAQWVLYLAIALAIISLITYSL
ncbi:MAG: CDP-alcohol phosphatidyltransferase family protein [Nanoarchaeota archaeon]